MNRSNTRTPKPLQQKIQLQEYELDCFGEVDDAPNRGARILRNFKIEIKLESE
jgi:hypothetical protein